MAALALQALTTLLVVRSAVAASIAAPVLTSTVEKRAACAGNTADDRASWCDFSIDTDWQQEVPDTGVTREYWLELDEQTVSPDGFARPGMTVNGSIPGPTITADWGDEIVVHIINNLSTNGTSIHWHGLKQNHTNANDGVVSITQCAQAPGDSFTYRFRATQYGTTWYHSHFSLQAWDGIFGAIVINGPATANYDVDVGPIIIADWFHESVYALQEQARTGGPPPAQNGLINGTNVFGDDGAANQTGSRFELTFEAGTSYRLRLINVAIDSHFKFMIDNHTLTVIAMDLVPVEPFTVDVLSLGIAERYDVIVNADQSDVASDFWMRFIPQAACSNNDQADNIRGIIHYGDSTGTPTTSQYDFTDDCLDVDMSLLHPHVAKTVPTAHFYEEKEEVGLSPQADGALLWTINGSSLAVQWGDPTLLQVINNDTAFDTSQNVVRLDEANQWAYIIIETTLGVAHPIHLHGHDFFLLSQGDGAYDAATTPLVLDNPPRRDVAMLNGGGHLVLAWETDNPGAWLIHCHIGWHTVNGLAFQFLERVSEIPAVLASDSIDANDVQQNCNDWNTYASDRGIVVDDSGV
ncbi:laccase Lcc4 [Lophiotrema nucula]|uniref:laccase n=1 Tax=Lophiotrema nucula TaxID=690887 RepID=A0A6A5ZWC0_9PLEO|nr:laccase Lcc4 [Lophiotrema nucula]